MQEGDERSDDDISIAVGDGAGDVAWDSFRLGGWSGLTGKLRSRSAG